MKIPPKHVLVVEDESGVREACRLLLCLDGHTVAAAKDGIEALDLFAKDRFDLVMTDFLMPGMNGCDLAAKLKQLAPSLRILMITGYAMEVGASENHVDAILPKPFSLAELRQVFEQLLS
jgi:CheY-like chemotaxis protein